MLPRKGFLVESIVGEEGLGGKDVEDLLLLKVGLNRGWGGEVEVLGEGTKDGPSVLKLVIYFEKDVLTKGFQ